MSKEIRHFKEAIEVRDTTTKQDEMVIEGYALKFGTWSELLGNQNRRFRETIDKRALV